MMSIRRCAVYLLIGSLLVHLALSQGRRSRRHETAVENRAGVPPWHADEHMPHDLFTFVRLKYGSYGWRDRWATDYPYSDYNFSWRLNELTSLEVAPDPITLAITDPELFDYPFVYMLEVGDLAFSKEEASALRSYLLRGGFLMVDDFWGEYEYDNFAFELKQVFPDRDLQEIPLDHEIFHCVFDLKEKPQVPSIDHALRGRFSGRTWEREDAKEPHYQALYDDDGRMMCIVCHNTDLGDGWEREGENHWYFKEFSEKKAYPMGINIVYYAMTH